MRSSNKNKYFNIQHMEGHSTPVSSLRRSEENNSSQRFSYQSIPSSLGATYSSSNYASNSTSIRNSAYSRSTAFCLRQFLWCVTCYESKFVTIEPVLFIVMFAVYLHKLVFELYVFNTFARDSIGANDTSYSRRNNASECISTASLSNVTYIESRYNVDFLWSSKTGDLVEISTGVVVMIVNITLGVFSILGTLMLGPLSNRFGRKYALVTILTGMLLQTILTVLIIDLDLDVHYFILGSGLRGITGGVAGIYTVSYSYISELNRDRKKWLVLRIGVVETLSFVAVSLGLIMGGVSINELRCNFAIPAYTVLGCLLCMSVYTAIATSESREHIFAITTNRSPLPRRKEDMVHSSPRVLLKGAQLFLSRSSPRLKLWLSIVVMMITVMNSSGMAAVLTLFLLHQPLVWSPLYIGGYLGMSEFLHGLVLVVVLPFLLSAGIHDGTIVTLSVMVTMGMHVMLGFSNAPWQVFLVGIIQSVEVLIVPTLKAMLAKGVSTEDRGPLFTFISIAQVVGTILGSAVYIPIYILSLRMGWPHNHSSGTAFLLMAAVYTFTIPLMCVLSLTNWMEKRKERRDNINSDPPSTAYYTERSSSTTGAMVAATAEPSWRRQTFDISIGREATDSLQQQQQQQQQQQRNKDLLEHSYSSLSDYHANKQ